MSDGARAEVTMTEVAEFAGVRRPTVSNWRRRHPGFPQPVDEQGHQPRFDAEELAEWLDRRPLPKEEQDSRLSTYGDRFRVALSGSALAALRGVLPGDELVRSALAHCARAATDDPEVTELAGRILAKSDESRVRQAVAALVENIGPAKAAERVLAESERLGASLRASTTPEPVSDLIAGLAKVLRPSSVLDPVAGIGTLLLAVTRATAPERVAAWDVNPEAITMLRLRAAAHGMAVWWWQGDSLRAQPADPVDLVVLDPPFLASDRGGRTDAPVSAFEWLVRVREFLTEGGHALALVPAWTLDRQPGDSALQQAKNELIGSGALHAVFRLPKRANTFRVASELAVVWLVNVDRRVAEGPQTARVLLWDDDAAPGPWVANAVSDAMAWWAGDRPQRGVSVPIAALQRQDSVDPRRWRRSVEERSARLSGTAMQQVLAARARVSEADPMARPAPVVGEATGTRSITVREHVANRRLRVHPGRRFAARQVTEPTGSPAGSVVLLGAEEVRNPELIGSRRVDAESVSREQLVTDADVVVLAVGGLIAQVPPDEQCAVGAPVQSLRILPLPDADEGSLPWMTPRVLAALLSAPHNARQVSGALAERVELLDLALPTLTPEQVETLDKELAVIQRRRAELRRRLRAWDELAEAMGDGLASGALTVRPG